MNEKDKEEYLEGYKKAKEKGVPFFPDIVFKDALAALLVFLILVALAYFVGSPLEDRANPADANYTPKPEWYFLFLFQLLKYFPGALEVIGVVVLPTVVIILLFALPLLDRGPKRHFSSRRLIVLITVVMVLAIMGLTVVSVLEAPPPAEATTGDKTAALYAKNCAGCHGQAIAVASGTNLHDIIAQGQHEGMPAWTADLTSDEIDALAGFILSPAGSKLFTDNCSACHDAPELVAGNPLALKTALDEGSAYPAHSGVDIPEWSEVLSREERTSLLNFLLAPDGQRLFATNCSSCHGNSVAFVGEVDELTDLISKGGLHLEMPPWREKLSDEELDLLAQYVVEPSTAGQALYEEHCVRCHGDRIPVADNIDEAREIIATGGTHETMPVWGEQLTSEQIDALVTFTLAASSGTFAGEGQELFADNCASCHGALGEGGENPSRPGDIIAPISTAEYLKTRDDSTLRAIISQGQPNFGMSPFGSAFGGPLEEDQISALVTFMRSWEADPPVDLPPDTPLEIISLSGFDIFVELCAQCHAVDGRGGIAPSLRAYNFRDSNSSQDIFDTIDTGHASTDMIAWGAILNAEQITDLVDLIEEWPVEEPTPDPATRVPSEMDDEFTGEPATTPEPTVKPTEAPLSFSGSVQPILDARCVDCHGSDGGWDAETYESVMTTGDNGPVVLPGDPDGSLLIQKLLGTHQEGDLMPPPPIRGLNADLIQIIIDWVAAGALEN